MESLAECLAAQDEIRGKYESLLLRVEDEFKPQLTRLHDLAIHSLEETAISIEDVIDPRKNNVEIKKSGYPQIFNFIFQFIEKGEDITDEELSRLSDSEILYLVSLLNCLPESKNVINHIFKFSVFNHQTEIENSLKKTYPILTFNPEWLIEAALSQDVELVRKYASIDTPQEILKKALKKAAFHLDGGSSEIHRILGDLIEIDKIRLFYSRYNSLRIAAGLKQLPFSN